MLEFSFLVFLLVVTVPALLVARKATCKILAGTATRGDVIAYAASMAITFSFLGMVFYLVNHPLIIPG